MKTLNELKREEYEHVSNSGGWLGLHESDDTLNDLNRKQIAAFVQEHGAAWLGSVNFYGDQCERIKSGAQSVYTEYTGQMVYNFDCAFCVPSPDEELGNLIRRWNSEYKAEAIDAIMNRIDEIGGINLIWT